MRAYLCDSEFMHLFHKDLWASIIMFRGKVLETKHEQDTVSTLQESLIQLAVNRWLAYRGSLVRTRVRAVQHVQGRLPGVLCWSWDSRKSQCEPGRVWVGIPSKEIAWAEIWKEWPGNISIPHALASTVEFIWTLWPSEFPGSQVPLHS